jgi:hypothetical protein
MIDRAEVIMHGDTDQNAGRREHHDGRRRLSVGGDGTEGGGGGGAAAAAGGGERRAEAADRELPRRVAQVRARSGSSPWRKPATNKWLLCRSVRLASFVSSLSIIYQVSMHANKQPDTSDVLAGGSRCR